jgi:hypothetical protein
MIRLGASSEPNRKRVTKKEATLQACGVSAGIETLPAQHPQRSARNTLAREEEWVKVVVLRACRSN